MVRFATRADEANLQSAHLDFCAPAGCFDIQTLFRRSGGKKECVGRRLRTWHENCCLEDAPCIPGFGSDVVVESDVLQFARLIVDLPYLERYRSGGAVLHPE